MSSAHAHRGWLFGAALALAACGASRPADPIPPAVPPATPVAEMKLKVDDVTASTDEDLPVTVTIAASGADGLVLKVSRLPGHGSVSLTGDKVTYSPAPDFHGEDAFEITASAGATSATGVVRISVGAINDVPVAVSESSFTAEDEALAGTLSATDVDSDDVLTYSIVTVPAHGTVTITNAITGAFLYEPAADYHGADAFTFLAFDGSQYSDPVTRSLLITSVNDRPLAAADAYDADEDVVLSFDTPGVLANDVDADTADTLTASLVTAPTLGSLTLAGDGSLTYAPFANQSGGDWFTYKVSDGTAFSAIVKVDIALAAVNDAPVAATAAGNVAEGGVLNATVSATDVDAGDALTYSIVTYPAHGTATVTDASSGTFSYQPDDYYVGSDSFTFRAFDGLEYSAPASYWVQVSAVTYTGYGLSPYGFPASYDAMPAFFAEAAAELSHPAVMWNGAWRDDAEFGTDAGTVPFAASYVALAAEEVGFTPVIVFGWRSGSTLLIQYPGNTTNDWSNAGAAQLFADMVTTYLSAHPVPFVFLGNENDAYFESDPVDYARWVTVYNTVYDAAKAVSPNTQIGPVFQYENLSGQGVLNGWTTAHWGALDAHDLSRIDILGVTLYPFLHYAEGALVPETHLDPLVARIGDIPIAITETGWPAEALGELTPPWAVSEQEQVDYLGSLVNIVKRHDVRIVNWLFLHAMVDTSAPEQRNLGWEIFGSVSVRNPSGGERAVYTPWRGFSAAVTAD